MNRIGLRADATRVLQGKTRPIMLPWIQTLQGHDIGVKGFGNSPPAPRRKESDGRKRTRQGQIEKDAGCVYCANPGDGMPVPNRTMILSTGNTSLGRFSCRASMVGFRGSSLLGLPSLRGSSDVFCDEQHALERKALSQITEGYHSTKRSWIKLSKEVMLGGGITWNS